VIARASSLLALAVGLAACSSGSDQAPPRLDGGRPRRVIEPPTGTVRPLPPHGIDPGGIGPYRLGVTHAEVLAPLPVPRSVTLEIEEVLDSYVVRFEDDQILLGGRPGEPISFIAALAKDIIRTEAGLGVGARRGELTALGAERQSPRAARDPRIVIPASMPGTRFLLDNDVVVAILLRDEASAAPAAPASDGGAAPLDAGVAAGCAAALPASEPDVVAAAGLKSVARVFPACLSAAGAHALVVAGDVMVVIDAEGAKARRVAKEELRGLVWASPLRVEPDRDDLVAVTEQRDGDEVVLTLHTFRLEGGRLVRLASEEVYELTETRAQWIGARVEDLRLLLTVEARGEDYEVGGVLIHLSGGLERAARDVAPLLPKRVDRKPRAPRPPTEPASARDAGAPARDAAAVAPRDL
jgi:hypothetical protein